MLLKEGVGELFFLSLLLASRAKQIGLKVRIGMFKVRHKAVFAVS